MPPTYRRGIIGTIIAIACLIIVILALGHVPFDKPDWLAYAFIGILAAFWGWWV